MLIVSVSPVFTHNSDNSNTDADDLKIDKDLRKRLIPSENQSPTVSSYFNHSEKGAISKNKASSSDDM